MKKLLTVTLSCLLVLFAHADTFTVTSNADSGPGTLREAITLAAINGTAVYDTIRFNIADLSEAGRTIAFNSQLPLLSSKLVIDGTTQPGNAIGVSNAKIIIKPGRGYLYIGLVMLRASQIEIYGLCFTGIPNDPDLSYTGCIYGYAVQDIVIGKPSKGNLFYDCGLGVHFSGLYSNRDSLNKRLTVQSNIFGLVDDGEKTVSNFSDALFENCTETLVGGDTESEANYFTAWLEGLKIFSFNYSNAPFTDSGLFRVKGNYFGLSYRTKRGISTTQAISAIGWLMPTNISLEILNNDLRYSSILLQKITPKFLIKGNRVQILWINQCKSGVIGGPGTEKNFIGPNNNYAGVNVYESDSITITQNSIFCNPKGIQLSQDPRPSIVISDISPTAVKGTADPFSTVEVFGVDTCTDKCQNGTIFLGSTTTSANGDWIFPTNYQGVISATATLPWGRTSEFAAARINTNNVVIKNASCGKNNGSIKGAILESGTAVYWENGSGTIIGNSLDLTDIGPGYYRLVGKMGNSSCKTFSQYFLVADLPKPQLSASDLLINQPSCGQPTGKIDYRSYNLAWSYRWYKDGVLFDTSNNRTLSGLAPATYSVSIRLKADSTCFFQSEDFSLKSQSGPSLLTTAVAVTAATCGDKNGSIKGITSTNVSGTPQLLWVDSLNKLVGTGYDLLNVPSGKYRLKFKDEGGCDTIITPFYTVVNNGEIRIDTSNRIISPTKCSGNTGSIRNIAITGGEIYTWKNTATHAIVGNAPDVSNLPAGTYQLTVANSYGCSQTAPPVVVKQTGFDDIGLTTWHLINASCGKANGLVEATSFRKDAGNYTFRWVDSTSNQTIGQSPKIENLDAGTYLLFAKDSNGCEGQIIKARILRLPMLNFDYSNLRITPDQCLTGQGAIAGMVVKDMQGNASTYAWFDVNNTTVGTTLDIQSLKKGSYQLKATDGLGCTAVSNSIEVDNRNVTLAAPQYDEQVILKNTTATLKVKNSKTGTYQLFDNASATTPIQQNTTGIFMTPVLTSDQVFYVRYVDGVCQSDLVSVNVKVIDKTAIYVPSAFTPNGDGKNDVLKAIAYGQIKLNYFTIYNRWGNAVFSTTSFSKGWNGTINGQPAETGTYVWIVQAVDEISGKRIEQKGTVTIIR